MHNSQVHVRRAAVFYQTTNLFVMCSVSLCKSLHNTKALKLLLQGQDCYA